MAALPQIWRKERKRGKRPQAWVQKHTLASPPQREEQPAAGRRRRPPPVLRVNQIAWTSDNARVCADALFLVSLKVEISGIGKRPAWKNGKEAIVD